MDWGLAELTYLEHMSPLVTIARHSKMPKVTVVNIFVSG
jgi:hypothetical protein